MFTHHMVNRPTNMINIEDINDHITKLRAIYGYMVIKFYAVYTDTSYGQLAKKKKAAHLI